MVLSSGFLEPMCNKSLYSYEQKHAFDSTIYIQEYMEDGWTFL